MSVTSDQMELRTKINIEQSPLRITYNDRVLLIGSCFATSIGAQMIAGRMPALVNPAGSVYNPVSVINTINTIISGKEMKKEDLYFHNGTWLSFSHYTDFSSENAEKVLDKINVRSNEAYNFLKKAKFLIVTFGTARVFKLKKTGEIVSNCHKLPASLFERELLKVSEIVELWMSLLDKLNVLFPELEIIFTVSPVRHLKDGAHGNQVSKSVLFLAIEELLQHRISPHYFPAYELIMDDLRDYRFYADDMLHPTQVAIDYIWEAFSGIYMDKRTIDIWKEASRITKAAKHRLNSDSGTRVREFAENMIRKISDIETNVPGIDFSIEKKYFMDLIK